MSLFEKIRVMSLNVLSHLNLSVFVLIAFASSMIIGCSKSSDSKPAGGCTFTFKGTSYSLPNSVCGTDAATGIKTNGGSNATSTQLLSLTKGEVSGFSLDGIIFSTSVGSGVDSWELNGGSISISGTTWTFSGTLTNTDDGVTTGEISGKCICTISN